jgi:hypothetical protein
MVRALKAIPTTQGWCRRGKKRSAYVIPTPKAASPQTTPLPPLPRLERTVCFREVAEAR